MHHPGASIKTAVSPVGNGRLTAPARALVPVLISDAAVAGSARVAARRESSDRHLLEITSCLPGNQVPIPGGGRAERQAVQSLLCFTLASAGGRALLRDAMAEATRHIPTRPARLAGMTPVRVAAGLRHLPGLLFFDTAGNLPASAGPAVSVITACPARILRGSIFVAADRAVLRQALTDMSLLGMAEAPGFPLGGLCGWVDYEGGFVFGAFPEMLVFNHADQTWWETGRLSTCLREPVNATVEIRPFEPTTTRDQFLHGVERIKEWLAAGDIYQVNLSQSFVAQVTGGSLFGLYEALREASPAPMAAWLSLDGIEVLSASPELFLKITGRSIETRPIKGTRPRFADPDDDRRSACELQASAKEIAELVMITDLLRNDLGQVCEFGSVQVAAMRQLESLAQVHHLVSTVTGTLRQDTDAIDALAACFPGGSITGAPKKRAMEIIRELEQRPRGIYCGAIGWFGSNGECSFNIAIRTLVRNGQQLVYQVGAGIVADSDPALEYEETLHKAAGIRLAVNAVAKRHPHNSHQRTDRESHVENRKSSIVD
ncbi:MAG: aminodeoxychorismate synthase component I [Verrucomicrobia bacterium]|nr:aminodeoxychorismate synthase component I [Verrucomicrobiota bacterium]